MAQFAGIVLSETPNFSEESLDKACSWGYRGSGFRFGTLASGFGEMIWRAHPLHGMTSPDARALKFVAVQL